VTQISQVGHIGHKSQMLFDVTYMTFVTPMTWMLSRITSVERSVATTVPSRLCSRSPKNPGKSP